MTAIKHPEPDLTRWSVVLHFRIPSYSLYRVMLTSIYPKSKGLSMVLPNLALILLSLLSNYWDISVKYSEGYDYRERLLRTC